MGRIRIIAAKNCFMVKCWECWYFAKRFAAKRSGGLDALNWLNAQCLLIAQLIMFALSPPFFFGAVMGYFYNCYPFLEPKNALAIEPISET